MNNCSYEKESDGIKIAIFKDIINSIADVRERGAGMKKTYKIEVDCANCAAKMEEAAKRTEGVKDAIVNFMTLKMNVEFEEGHHPKDVMPLVLKNCRKVEDECEIFF